MADEVHKILQSRLRKNAEHSQQYSGGDACYKSHGSHHSADDPYAGHSSKRKRANQTQGQGEDPMSHKIIEKRRRDRMNSCLAELSLLIPSTYSKKGRGRIEKTEIVEMAIKHIRHLQQLVPSAAATGGGASADSHSCASVDASSADVKPAKQSWLCPQEEESFKNGYNECLAEAVHYLVKKEQIPPEHSLCVKLVGHLKNHLDKKMLQQPSETNSSVDSDYCSLRSEGSTSNSEVSSVLPAASLAEKKSFHMASSESHKKQAFDEVSGGKFKFKDSIRERFTHESFETQHEHFSKRRRQHSQTSFSQYDPQPCSSHQSSNQNMRSDPQPVIKVEPKKSLPIFALHPKGSHYIPMHVSEEVIVPYLHLFEQSSELPLMLHPVTISVNFCGPLHLAASNVSSTMDQELSYKGELIAKKVNEDQNE